MAVGIAGFIDATVNGVKLHYLDVGKGPAILLLHGFAQTSHMWLPLVGELSKTNRVIAPDLRGAGGSGKPHSGYDKKTLAQDTHALTESLGIDRIRVVGHDIGLMVAYAYAARYAEQVERIVLMDAFLPGIGDWKRVWLDPNLWHFHFFGEVPSKLVAGRERIYLEHFWNEFAADETKSISEADRKLYAAAYAQPGAIHAGFEYFRTFLQDAADFADFSKTPLPMPMLVITGEKAAGQSLIDQALLIATHVESVIVPDSGHWLMEEAPQQVIPKLIEFLARKNH